MKRKKKQTKRSLISEASDPNAPKPEQYSMTSMNGLMRLDVIFGMIRQPENEDEVREGFTAIVFGMRALADSLEKSSKLTPPFAPGGSA